MTSFRKRRHRHPAHPLHPIYEYVRFDCVIADFVFRSYTHTHTTYMNTCACDYSINTGPLKGILSHFCIEHAHKWEATAPPVHHHKNACFKHCYYILTYEYIIEKYIFYQVFMRHDILPAHPIIFIRIKYYIIYYYIFFKSIFGVIFP